MKQKAFLALAILSIILVSGCIEGKTSTSESEEKNPPSINVYGKLTDYTEESNVGILKIECEILNYEIKKSTMEIKVNLSENTDYEKEIEEAFKKFKKSPSPKVLSELINGNYYVFSFWENHENEDVWSRVFISENLTEYQKQGAWYHNNDLATNQIDITEEKELEPEQQRMLSIRPKAIILGKPTEIKISLINNQNNEIKYKIKNAKLVNEEASRWSARWWEVPPYEEMLKNATIDECIVHFNTTESKIFSNSIEILSFVVTCPLDINITKNYEICDNYREKINCRMKTADRIDMLMLWGEIEFTDELGNIHTLSEKGVLKQMIHIAYV